MWPQIELINVHIWEVFPQNYLQFWGEKEYSIWSVAKLLGGLLVIVWHLHHVDPVQLLSQSCLGWIPDS